MKTTKRIMCGVCKGTLKNPLLTYLSCRFCKGTGEVSVILQNTVKENA